jgi:hypothetical protein
MKTKVVVTTILIVISLSCLVAVAAEMLTVSPESLIAQYGAPDSIDSTEYDKPRPPIVTKWLIYKKEKVKIMLVADAPMGSPPPYQTWKLFGVMDSRSNAMLEPPEFKKRMARRIQKNK